MSQEAYVYEDDVEAEETEETDASQSQQETAPAALREAAKRGKAVIAERDALKRENAFLRAGIDPQDKRLRYFAAGYDGDLDSEAIKLAAVEAGFMVAAQADPAVAVANAAEQRVVSASTGAAPEAQGLDAAAAQMQEVLAQHGSQGLAAVLASSGFPTTQDG